MIRGIDIDKTGLNIIQLESGEDSVDYLTNLKKLVKGFQLLSVKSDSGDCIEFYSLHRDGKKIRHTVYPKFTKLLVRNGIVITDASELISNNILILKYE